MERNLEASLDTGNLGAVAGAGLAGLIIFLAIMVFMIVTGWKLYAKAGKPGWAVLVPIYNIIVALEIIGKPLWWIVLFLIPFVSLVAMIIMALEMAKAFGKSSGFGVGLILLPFVFYPILAFGSAQYKGVPAKV